MGKVTLYMVWRRREDKGGWFRSPEELKMGEKCWVEGREGKEIGEVRGKTEIEEGWGKRFPSVLGKLTPQEEEKLRELIELEKRAYQVCREKIRDLVPVMNLVRVRALPEGDKIIFYFTAPTRVDFRKLVRELAKVFRRRIEMRQIGVRDKARFMRGLGPCGRPLCCHAFLTSFEAVNVRKAKDQNLTLDPYRIGGLCGRLRCCLSYEWPLYREMNKLFPRIGSRVRWDGKKGEVVKISPLRGTVLVKREDGIVEEVSREKLEK